MVEQGRSGLGGVVPAPARPSVPWEVFLVSTVPDCVAAEREWVAEMPGERFGRPVLLESAETGLPDRDSVAVTSCPALDPQARGVEFAVCEPASDRCSARFVRIGPGAPAPSGDA